ncbi:MAG TPA: DMT family transporter [Beijerinckiaceae bacterium]|jgi:drug/metabolite transporter (DMT)-like permease
MRPAAALRPAAPSLSGADLGLYGTTVLVWGTSWIALKAQLGGVAPEVSLAWRFLLAAALMLAWVAWRGERMRYAAADHLRFALTGLFMFSGNFTLFYYGGATIPSGLLAVIFSLASVINLVLGALLLRQPIEGRVALGGCLGAAGIGLLFWPEIARAGAAPGVLAGLGLCAAGTLCFCLGNVVSTGIQRRGVPILAANAWGMVYGAGLLVAASFVRGHAFIVEPTWRYLGSLVYLATFASVIAFACYLTLLRRIGAARAGYATVLFPIVALGVSTAVEGYHWTPLAVLGAAAALAGNGLVLSRR